MADYHKAILETNIRMELNFAYEKALRKVDKLINSGCVDVPTADMLDAKALAAALLEDATDSLCPSVRVKKWERTRDNARCFV